MLPALQVHLTFLLLFDRCFLTDLSLILVRNQSFCKINVSIYKSLIAILIRIQFYLVFQFYLQNLRMKFPPIFHKECVASFFFYLGFLSRPFTVQRTARKEGGHFFNSSLPLPPASQTFRH